jgi:hypothetical protein
LWITADFTIAPDFMSSDLFRINILTFELSLWYARPRPFIYYMTRKTPIGKTYQLPGDDSLRVENNA